MGLRAVSLHHGVGRGRRVSCSGHDQHVLDDPLVLVWGLVLDIRKAVQDLDKGVEGAQGRSLNELVPCNDHQIHDTRCLTQCLHTMQLCFETYSKKISTKGAVDMSQTQWRSRIDL